MTVERVAGVPLKDFSYQVCRVVRGFCDCWARQKQPCADKERSARILLGYVDAYRSLDGESR